MSPISDKEVEHYSFLRLYAIDLEMARQACDLLDEQTSLALRFSVLRDVVISYARPFSSNLGPEHPKGHKLKIRIPGESRALHKELVGLRNTCFAHTDVKFRRPEIARWEAKDGESVRYVMGFSNPSYEILITRSVEIRNHIVGLEQTLAVEIRRREADFDQRLAAEP